MTDPGTFPDRFDGVQAQDVADVGNGAFGRRGRQSNNALDIHPVFGQSTVEPQIRRTKIMRPL